jgi:hypothetical protein
MCCAGLQLPQKVHSNVFKSKLLFYALEAKVGTYFILYFIL